LPRTNGKLCAKGQGGVGQVYDPDRLLRPLIRSSVKAWLDAGFTPGAGPTADRGGAGDDWVTLTWAEAQAYMAQILGDLRTKGEPEQLFFHYGRMKASASKIIKSHLLPLYGTASIGNHTSICESAKWTAQELTWGKHYDVNDLDNTQLIINFGCNPMETHTSHIPISQRVSKAVQGGAELHTFDVRLSSTAAKSTKWYPVMPGTDLAVILAMCHEIVNNHAGKIDTDFINDWCYAGEFHGVAGADNVARITSWLNAEGYTPAWAAGISGVPAADITALAAKYMDNQPATVITYRGAVTHWNGIQTERAAQLLQALAGAINVVGGRVQATGASYSSSWKTQSGGDKLAIIDGGADLYVERALGTKDYLVPSHHASHQTFNAMVDKGIYPRVYLSYCYAPVFANGDVRQNEAVLKDRSKIEVVVTVSTTFSEACEVSDIVIPDASYLERWDWEDMVSYNQIPEYYIRQPVVAPIDGVRDFKDFFKDVMDDLGILPKNSAGEDIAWWDDAEDFVRDACTVTTALADAGGFDFMRANGAYYDTNATPKYNQHMSEVDNASLFTGGNLNSGIVFSPDDPALESFSTDSTTPQTPPSAGTPGVFWEAGTDWDLAGLPPRYHDTKKAYKLYKGRGTFGGTIYAGFKPDKLELPGLFEIYSSIIDHKLESYGGDAGASAGWVWPNWMDIPEHSNVNAASGRLLLTHYKDRAHTHSRTQNCKVLSELMHDNPAWMNKATADALGIADGDDIKITNSDMLAPGRSGSSEEITAKVRVTEAIHPNAIAMAHHAGHWQHGRYATAGQVAAPNGRNDDPDLDRIWWSSQGVRVNLVMPNSGDPIGGMLRYGDTVVTVAKA
jgi:anaerobic selenocysteine-containing dehydrogenase